MRLSLETLNELLDYHYDRRERLYDFVAAMRPEDFTRDVGVGWRSIRTTLVHAIEAEEYWMQRLRQGEMLQWDPAAYPDVQSVRRLAAQVRDRTRAFVAGLSEEDLGRVATITFSDGTTSRFTFSKAFLHVITHDAHHRGQVLAVARQMGYQPPDLDLM